MENKPEVLLMNYIKNAIIEAEQDLNFKLKEIVLEKHYFSDHRFLTLRGTVKTGDKEEKVSITEKI